MQIWLPQVIRSSSSIVQHITVLSISAHQAVALIIILLVCNINSLFIICNPKKRLHQVIILSIKCIWSHQLITLSTKCSSIDCPCLCQHKTIQHPHHVLPMHHIIKMFSIMSSYQHQLKSCPQQSSAIRLLSKVDLFNQAFNNRCGGWQLGQWYFQKSSSIFAANT